MNDLHPKCLEKRRILGFLPEFLPFIKKTTSSIVSMRAISSAFAARLALFLWSGGRMDAFCTQNATALKPYKNQTTYIAARALF